MRQKETKNEAHKIPYSEIVPIKIAYRIWEGAMSIWGIILDKQSVLGSCREGKHSYRVWFENGKYLCGFCGVFIYKRKRSVEDLKVFFQNKFGRQCFSCMVNKSSLERERVVKEKIKELEEQNDFSSDQYCQLKYMGTELLSLKFNHTIWCKLKNYATKS